jgi:hypothetical protein
MSASLLITSLTRYPIRRPLELFSPRSFLLLDKPRALLYNSVNANVSANGQRR